MKDLKKPGHQKSNIPLFKRHEYSVPFNESLLGKTNLEIIHFLKDKTNLFRELPPDMVEQLGEFSEIEYFKQGESILVENTPNEKIYFLMKGVLGVYKENEFVLSLKRKGDIIGEMSLISDKLCSASIIAEVETEVFSIKVRNIGGHINVNEKLIRDSLYSLYAVILADKLTMTTYKAIGLEQKVQIRTNDLANKNKELQIAKQEAEMANRAKTDFLTNITHELRTPMHHIYSFTQIGIQFFESKKHKSLECFNKILISCHSMMGLIDKLIDFSKIETGKINYVFSENDILAIIDENVAAINHEIQQKKITVTIKRPRISTIVVCDRRAIGQVIRNLLSNAIKFSKHKKTIEIIISSADLPASDNLMNSVVSSILISIKDEGHGIPEDELDYIFDKFTQSSRTKTGAGGGTGLGLAVCYEIIKAHHGIIWAENNPDGGSIFKFAIPYQQTMDPGL